MDGLRVQRTSISSPTLASIIQRFYCSPGDVDGLLFGRVYQEKSPTLTDDESCTATGSSSAFIALVTGLFCFTPSPSFYDATGDLRSGFSPLIHCPKGSTPLGWFSGRRRTPLRPSMREYSVSNSLASAFAFHFPDDDATGSINFTPCIFFLLVCSIPDQLIHTNEYLAYQYVSSTNSLDPLSVEIINVGPSFRGHYGSFIPTSNLPSLPHHSSCSESSMSEDVAGEDLPLLNLSCLVGSEAASYTLNLENLYEKMIENLEILARRIEKSSAEISKLEDKINV